MKILSHALIEKPDSFPEHWATELKAVLTCGNLSTLTGNFSNDIAVYVGLPRETPEEIARTGAKLSHKMANTVGYAIRKEDYRL